MEMIADRLHVASRLRRQESPHPRQLEAVTPEPLGPGQWVLWAPPVV